MSSVSKLHTAVHGVSRAFRVLVVGGSYGGLSAALNLQDLCNNLSPRCGPKPTEGESPAVHPRRPHLPVDITIVDRRDGFYHLIGSPLALASEAYADKCWVKYDEIPALKSSSNIRVLQGSMQSIDPERKVATYLAHGADTQPSELQYDYFVAASGLHRVWPVVPQSLRKKQYLFEAGDHIRAVTTARHGVVVIGGGAVGIEMAAELKLVQPHLKVTLVHSRDKLLSSEPLPDEVKDRSLELVRAAGVDVLLGHRLDNTEEVADEAGHKCLRVHFTNGHSMLADHVTLAVSRSVPSTGYLPSGVMDGEGYVRIQASLSFPPDAPNAADHFAVGDLAKWSGIKRCGAAMHMGYYAAHNMHQRMLQQAQNQSQSQSQVGSGEGQTTQTTEGVSCTEQRQQTSKLELLELGEIPPMIGLAVGNQAVAYWPEGGMTSGEDVMKVYFGVDLGFTICWNHLGLGKEQLV